MKNTVVAFVVGVLMAAALGLSGMTQPSKVIGFLDVAGRFDPSLAFVMAGAIAVHFVSFRLIMRRAHPLFAPSFCVPQQASVDVALLVGAAVFGVGWGLAGYCPGPAVVSVGAGRPEVILFVAAMITGQRLHDAVARRIERAADDA